MAKLTAHGHELYRLERTKAQTDPATITERSTYTVSVRSDGAVLERLVVVFRGADGMPGQRKDYGWKLKYTGPRLRAVGHTPERVRDIYVGHGYTCTHTNLQHREATVRLARKAGAP